jgi:probable phosphoglycerate mutase
MASSLNINQLEYPVLNLYDRAAQFWQEILPLHPNKTILIISHGGTIRALISSALGISSRYYHFLQQSNCGISTLEFDSQNPKSCSLTTMNSTEHLGEILPKLKAGKQGIRLILLPSNNIEKERFEALVKSLQPVNLIREILGGSIDPNHLIIQPGKITVVHYPESTHHPIIQAINL